ncbi:MAG: argininosuccinate lyase [Candidatus Omnitrophica bacterium]|nr:argininosuccinate lyase [Candidatus Omnitrophota bacterium]
MTKLWGGRFAKKIDPKAESFSRSIQYDHKLAEFDILGSLCQIEIIKKANIITAKEYNLMKKGLNILLKDLENGKFDIDFNAEDIHSVVQDALLKKIGKTALKLHTARSRNDQVLFDTKMFSLKSLYDLVIEASYLIKSLKNTIQANKDLILPGFTHMQHAMPVSLENHFGAYQQMIKRDVNRFLDIAENIKITFGSGALAGTNLPASLYNIKGLPFDKDMQPSECSMDSVSDRDFVIEILSSLSICGMHLSRMSEDMILWVTQEFNFIKLDQSYCTGSSLMPQKKNPDMLELIRGYTGKLYGNLVSVLTMMKGLPLTYNRDMQHDKEPLFESIDIVKNSLKLMAGMISTLRFNKKSISKHLEDESLYATDIAHYLVTKGIAFKDTHDIVGELVKYSLDSGKKIVDMTDRELYGFNKHLNSKILKKLIDPVYSVSSKKSLKIGK